MLIGFYNRHDAALLVECARLLSDKLTQRIANPYALPETNNQWCQRSMLVKFLIHCDEVGVASCFPRGIIASGVCGCLASLVGLGYQAGMMCSCLFMAGGRSIRLLLHRCLAIPLLHSKRNHGLDCSRLHCSVFCKYLCHRLVGAVI